MSKRVLAFVLAICLIVLPIGEIYANGETNEEPANLLERCVAGLITLSSVGLYVLTAISAGESITIESLLFNLYDNTRLTFFSDGSSGATNEYISGGIAEGINDFSKLFTSLAIIAYFIILIYMGIKILLSATADRRAKYKELLLYWVEGIAILFFFPYVIKYTIVLNDAFVKFIYDNIPSSYTITGANGGSSGASPGIGTVPTGNGLMDMNNQIMDTAEKLEGRNDYMSIMYTKAMNDGYIVYALCWTIMVKQLFVLFIMYIKRFLIIAFLIAIFPLVAISYAIDKIGDGKSQAFGNWYKEFAMNVFLQSFQAIVYVIGMGLIVQLGNPHENWLIILIIIGFISKGDDILRGIFHMQGGGGDTVKGIGATMLQIKGATEMAKSARDFVGRKFGADSNLAKGMKHVGNARESFYAMRLQNSHAELNSLESGLFDSTSESLIPVQAEPESEQERTPQQNVDMLYNQNATDEEREKALNELNQLSEEELNELRNYVAANYSGQENLDELLKVAAAARALSVGINLNENIEILLEAMKKDPTRESLAARLAMSTGKTQEELEKLQKLSQIPLRPPRSNANKKKRRSSARRYTPAYRELNRLVSDEAKTKDQIYAAQLMEMNRGGRRYRRRVIKKNVNRFKRKRVAAKEISVLENAAISQVRRVEKMRRNQRKIAKKYGTRSKKYKEVTERLTRLEGASNLRDLRAAREKYANQGIYFRGVGKTQKLINRNVNAEKRATIRRRKRREKETKVFAKNMVAKQKNGKQISVKELEALRRIANNQANSYSLLSGRRNANGKPPKMTRTQRNAAKVLNKVTVDYAIDAMNLRKYGKIAEAEELERKVRQNTVRAYRTRPGGKVALTRPTKAERILARGPGDWTFRGRVENFTTKVDTFTTKAKGKVASGVRYTVKGIKNVPDKVSKGVEKVSGKVSEGVKNVSGKVSEGVKGVARSTKLGVINRSECYLERCKERVR